MNQREEWLRQRQSGIGSSDAACLIGIGWQSARDIYYSKIEAVQVETLDGDLQRGIDLEPLVAQKYAAVMGVELKLAGFVRSKDYHWQYSNPDFIGIDGRYTEIKTVRGFDEDRGWGEQFTDQIPDKYLCQVQHQMGVKGDCDHMDLAAFDIYSWSFRVYRIRYDADFFHWLTDIERRAWIEIQARRPLAHEWEDQFFEDYKKRLVTKNTAMQLPERFGPLLDQIAELKAVAKEAEEAYKPMMEEVKREMGLIERATVGNWKIKRTVTSNQQVRFTVTPIGGKE